MARNSESDFPDEVAFTRIPHGSRFVGTLRFAVGIFLLLSWIPASIQGIRADGFLEAAPVVLLYLASGLLLTWRGWQLRKKKILRIPYPHQARQTTSEGSELSLLEDVAINGEKGKLKLYLRETQITAIKRLVLDHPTGTHSGVYVGTGQVLAEPTNPADAHAVQVWVEGLPVGYFFLEWKDRAHAQLRRDLGRPTLVPVVLRHWNNQSSAWILPSEKDAHSFAQWLTK